MKTSKDYTIADYRGYGEITVPAGTVLTHQTASGIDTKYHFVLDLSWITNNYPHLHRMQLLHDATYYGIDVPVEYVDYEKSPEPSKEAFVEAVTTQSTYYADQLAKVTPADEVYATKIKISHGNSEAQTNWLSLNDESATDLFKWLLANYKINTTDQLQYQINSAINVCNGRIESGANIQDAFKWLNEETEQIFSGETLYPKED